MTRAETLDKAHGRIETRRIAVRKPPARLNLLWPDVRQICRVERIREMKTYCERQIIYVITSLPPEIADAKRRNQSRPLRMNSIALMPTGANHNKDLEYEDETINVPAAVATMTCIVAIRWTCGTLA